jgi:hypothetical protein
MAGSVIGWRRPAAAAQPPDLQPLALVSQIAKF